MKKLVLTFLILLTGLQCYAQLHTFQVDDPVSAKEMNENFQHLEKQFRGTKSINIDCDNGGSISTAIANGFNDITVLGTCSENLRYTVWRDDSVHAYVPSGKFAPRFLKITGANQSAKIKDASSNSESLIYAAGGLTIFLKDITLEGGRRGVVGKRNSNLLLSNVTVSSFRDRGVDVQDSSYLGIDEGGVKIIGTNSTETDRGLNLGTGSTGWVSRVNISNVKRGITLYSGSFLTISEYTITASKRGIEIQDSGFDDSSSSDSSIEGSNEFALKVSNGSFYNRKGKLEIKNLIGGQGISLWQSKAEINNLRLLDFDNTGSGWNPAIRVGNISALNLYSSQISGATDESLINIDRSSMLEIGNSSISGTAGDSLIYIGRKSLSDIHVSTVSGTAKALIRVNGGSTLQVDNGTLSGTVQDVLIGISDGSSTQITNQSAITITGGGEGIFVGFSSNLNVRNSKISGPTTGTLIDLLGSSSAKFEGTTISGSTSNGVHMSMSASLELKNTHLVAASKGIDANENSSVRLSNGSTITSQNGYAMKARRASGFSINQNTSITSTGGYAIALDENSFVSLSENGPITIDRSDDGPDVNVSSGSVFTMGSGNTIGQITCGSRGFVILEGDAVVGSINSNCTE